MHEPKDVTLLCCSALTGILKIVYSTPVKYSGLSEWGSLDVCPGLVASNGMSTVLYRPF